MTNDPWDAVLSWLGIEGSSVLLTLMFVSMISNFLYRLIPDDAVGWKGAVKPILKVVGMYASNRVTAGITVNDVVKEVVQAPAREVGAQVEEVRERVDERIEEVVEEARDIVPAFPGLQNRERDPETGLFKPLLGIALMILTIPILSACATVPIASSALCSNRETIAALVALVEKDANHSKATAALAVLDATCPAIVREVRANG